MSRSARRTPGGILYHGLNRSVGGMRLFSSPQDYAACERALAEKLAARTMRSCVYCIMPNHWHLVLWPRGDGDLAAFRERLKFQRAPKTGSPAFSVKAERR